MKAGEGLNVWAVSDTTLAPCSASPSLCSAPTCWQLQAHYKQRAEVEQDPGDIALRGGTFISAKELFVLLCKSDPPAPASAASIAPAPAERKTAAVDAGGGIAGDVAGGSAAEERGAGEGAGGDRVGHGKVDSATFASAAMAEEERKLVIFDLIGRCRSTRAGVLVGSLPTQPRSIPLPFWSRFCAHCMSISTSRVSPFCLPRMYSCVPRFVSSPVLPACTSHTHKYMRVRTQHNLYTQV
jgi:hypothetical protein